MVTYTDIAKKAGVSTAAVSYALRNKPGVSQETRLKVLDAAQRMGYKPNPLVSAHMAYLRGTKKKQYKGKLAFLSSCGDQAATEADVRDSTYWHGAKEAATSHGFDIEVFSLVDPNLSPKRLSKMLWARGIPGIIIAPVQIENCHLNFDVSPFSAVTIGFTLKTPHLHRVRPNSHDMMLTLLSILDHRGYKRPGFVQTKMEDNWTQHLWSASYHVWRNFLSHPRKVPPMLLLEHDERDLFFRWYEKYNPDVVISVNDMIPEWMEDAGLKMPEDIGYATLFSMPQNSKYSGLHPNLKAIGKTAVQQVVSQIYNNETGEAAEPRLCLLPPKWHEGTTLKTLDKNIIASQNTWPSGMFTDEYDPTTAFTME